MRYQFKFPRTGFFTCAVGALLIWGSDRVTLQGERTIYTVKCERGAWVGLQCTGRIVAGDRHRFRSSRSRNEVLHWIAGSGAPSEKFTDCKVTDRDNWSCTFQPGQPRTITYVLAHGRPVSGGVERVLPCHAVVKWKWWALRAGISGFTKADYSNASTPNPLPGS